MIAIVFTGGTISMRIDPAAGGAVPTLTGAKLISLAPQIESLATLEVHEWATMPGAHSRSTDVVPAGLHPDLVVRPDINGVVVTQGTDTIEETCI